jgi:hypothetical protein
MKKSTTSESGSFSPRLLVGILLCMGIAGSMVSATLSTPVGKLGFLRREAPAKAPQRPLSFAERVSYQRAIENVYWRHRIWPGSRGENPDAKPSLDAVMTQAQLEKKVEDYLGESQTLEDHWQRPITAKQLQTEMDRMAQNTKQPEVLHELFEALGNDPFVIAECLARPVLADRLLTQSVAGQAKEISRTSGEIVTAAGYTLPIISDTASECSDNTWTTTSVVNAPGGNTAVWTGVEMIVWGGATGGRYNPSTDSWTATAIAHAPVARFSYPAVWSGTEMIIWGGFDGGSYFNTGGRYNPSTNSWTATTVANAPIARFSHTAVWTGSEMIVWGGFGSNLAVLNTGGRYNPRTDTWTATSTTNAPTARELHTAIWTGSDMIVWSGYTNSNPAWVNTGGRYNPNTDTWVATNTTNAPGARDYHTAVWTGSEMIVWGGLGGLFHNPLNTGGKYNPGTDTWIATGATNAPTGRRLHTAVWTGSEMIVWGGQGWDAVNTGGRYNPSMNSWTATTLANAPTARFSHTAVWTGREMIVWGGNDGISGFNTGGRYCAPFPGSQLGNISTRAFVQTGDNVMIGGFIVQGSQTKRVIIRAIGPELTRFGVPNPLFNPTLELHDGTGALIASNDNWMTTIIGGIITSNQFVEIRDSGHAPGDGRESAIIADLAPGNYTAIVRGVDNMTGVALAEVYDLSGDASSILGNISTRSFVQTGDNAMIGGFIVQGTQPKRVIIRGIGPELTQHGVPNPLADPTLELHNGTGVLIASNDNWQTTIIGGIIIRNQVQAIMLSGHAPTQPSESAIIADLPPGNYTAIVRGVNNTTGVALVEVYDFD